ncbi:MAG: hypothetical protein IJX72_00815 [Clostridia bacterium]|nr:hypothetical protein [Clostridia bacterium]
MKLKSHILFDRRQLLYVAMTVLLVFGTAVELTDASDGDLWWLLWGVLSLIGIGGAVLHPCLYVMTERGLYSFYLFGLLRRFIPWNTVRKLEIHYHTGNKSLPYLFDTFRIDGKAEGKTLFFTENEIIRTRRARRLLERYTGCLVEGYLIDDLRAWRKKRKAKKERMRRHRARVAREERNRRTHIQEKQNKKAQKAGTAGNTDKKKNRQ